MENKIEIKRDLAHVDYESGRYQTMKEHSENVANYVAETCSLSELKILVSLIGVFHDVGKLGRENQEDFERILQYGDDTHKVDSGESCKRLCAAFRCGNDKEKVSVFSSEHGKNKRM